MSQRRLQRAHLELDREIAQRDIDQSIEHGEREHHIASIGPAPTDAHYSRMPVGDIGTIECACGYRIGYRDTTRSLDAATRAMTRHLETRRQSTALEKLREIMSRLH